MRLFIYLSLLLFLCCGPGAQAEISAENLAKQQSQQSYWLIPELVAIPTNTTQIELSQVERYEPRKIAASLVERKRKFDERWMDESELNSGEVCNYELLSFFPEEFIAPLIENGQLNGHELPQSTERPVNVQAFVEEDLKVKDQNERRKRLSDDALFMQQRGQFAAAIEINKMVLALCDKSDPKFAEVSKRIEFLGEKAKDKSISAARQLGWERRADLEFLHLAIKVGSEYKGGVRNLPNSLLPKYGIVNFLSEVPLKVNRRELLHYGALIIVYRDEVKYRTSFSYGDSTVYSRDPASGKLKGPEVRSLMLLNPSALPVDQAIFVEAQVWGPIEMRDIKEFRVPEGRDDLVKALAKSGLPVYSYKRAELANEPIFVPAAELGVGRVKQLSAGDPTLEKKYEEARNLR